MEYGNARTVRLGSGWTPKNVSAHASMVFGELVKLALPVIESFHKDLYWDAMWLNGNLFGEESFTFYYGVRQTGTNIGAHEQYVTGVGNKMYRCTVQLDRVNSCRMIIEEACKVSRHG